LELIFAECAIDKTIAIKELSSNIGCVKPDKVIEVSNFK
jgi:hypothetical protein